MTMMERIKKMRVSDDALDLVFRKARTHNAWLPKPVPDELLQQLYDTLKWGPTSANISPARSRIHSFHGCKGTPPFIARAWERREDDDRSGHGHHRL